MNPVLLQKQLRENSNDLQQFCNDLKSWGEEMKRKEDSMNGTSTQQNETKNIEKKKVKKVRIIEPSTAKTKRCTDYTAWEKFDADAECGKIDDEDFEDPDLSDEFDDTKRDEALLHKEKGNKFVKNQKWEEAIECYTKAINCFRYDAVYYANRALCYLKLKQMRKVDEDCTLSLKLDPTYVKAYQRRAAAREDLGHLDDAKYDLDKVLKYEPNNKESKLALEKLIKKIEEKRASEPQRPISKFTASRRPFAATSNSQSVANKIGIPVQNKFLEENVQKQVDDSKNFLVWPSGDDVILVKPTKKPPHLQSKNPLKRMEIFEIDSSIKNMVKAEPVAVKEHVVERQLPVENLIPLAKASGDTCFLRTDDLKVIDKVPDNMNTKESNIFENNTEKTKIIDNKTRHAMNLDINDMKTKESNNNENTTDKVKMINSKTGHTLNLHVSDMITKESNNNENGTDKVNIVDNKTGQVLNIAANKERKNIDNGVRKLNSEVQSYNEILNQPKSSLEFNKCWKALKDINMKYQYLSKYIKPENIPKIFKGYLETGVFSDFLEIMVNYFIVNKDSVYEYLHHLTEIPRFYSMTLLLTTSDKSNLWKLMDYMKEHEKVTKEEVDKLIEKYEL